LKKCLVRHFPGKSHDNMHSQIGFGAASPSAGGLTKGQDKVKNKDLTPFLDPIPIHSYSGFGVASPSTGCLPKWQHKVKNKDLTPFPSSWLTTMSPVRINPLDTAWNRRFSGPAMRDRGRRGGALVFLQTLILMGDWCSRG